VATKEVQNLHRSRKRQAHQQHVSNAVPTVARQLAITPRANEVRAATAARATQIELARCLDRACQAGRRRSPCRCASVVQAAASHRTRPSLRAPQPRTHTELHLRTERIHSMCLSLQVWRLGVATHRRRRRRQRPGEPWEGALGLWLLPSRASIAQAAREEGVGSGGQGGEMRDRPKR
jgi:hypothetical protein